MTMPNNKSRHSAATEMDAIVLALLHTGAFTTEAIATAIGLPLVGCHRKNTFSLVRASLTRLTRQNIGVRRLWIRTKISTGYQDRITKSSHCQKIIKWSIKSDENPSPQAT